MSDQVRIAAAIDVGSNSVHLLLTELGGEVLRDESVLLGLGAMAQRTPQSQTQLTPSRTQFGREVLADTARGRVWFLCGS